MFKHPEVEDMYKRYKRMEEESKTGIFYNGEEVDEEFVKNLRDSNKNQKAKSDAGKPKLTLVPRKIIFDIAKIREYGNNKYPEGGPDNWKTVSKERYIDALFRHFMAYLDDPTGVDSESGLPHLWHLACNVAFLCEMEEFDCDHNS